MMEEKKDILILAIESSCDETAAAVVKNGRDVLSNVISSQIALHTLYGGVVPEIASRKHIEKINEVIQQALTDALPLQICQRWESPMVRGLWAHFWWAWQKPRPSVTPQSFRWWVSTISKAI